MKQPPDNRINSLQNRREIQPQTSARQPQLPAGQPKQTGVAYLCWCLCFVGIAGGQRFYVGKVGSGLLYLFTFGFFGIAQLIDLFTTGEMVDSYNMRKGFVPGAYANPLAHHQIVVNVGEKIKSSFADSDQTALQSQPDHSDEHKILTACADGGLSIAKIAIKTGISTSKIREMLVEMEQDDLVRVDISESGSILYTTT